MPKNPENAAMRRPCHVDSSNCCLGLHVENRKLFIKCLKSMPDGDGKRGGNSCGSHKKSRHPWHLTL
jgi:hypothetical protein